jgi:hypothetical protein
VTPLLFDSDYRDALLDGRKTATVRYDLDEDLSPGDRVELRTTDPGLSSESFGMATVADVVQTTVGDALSAVEDRGYQHNAESVADLWNALDGHYPDADIRLSTNVSVVLLDEIEERRFLGLERNSLDEAGLQATLELSEDTRYTAASFVVRGGLGPLFLNLAGPDGDNSLDPTPEEVGALLSVSFDPDRDPIHNAVYEWVVEEASGGVLLTEAEATEIADHLADYDITARLSDAEDDRPTEAVEWSRELRARIREVEDE